MGTASSQRFAFLGRLAPSNVLVLPVVLRQSLLSKPQSPQPHCNRLKDPVCHKAACVVPAGPTSYLCTQSLCPTHKGGLLRACAHSLTLARVHGGTPRKGFYRRHLGADMKPEHAQLLTRLIEQHPYLTRECSRYPLHDAIHKAQALHGLEPANMEELLLEWPHLSNDQARLAYTRTPAHGEADRQTVTTLGRYLTKCFPTAKSDVIRDIAALYQGSGCKFTERTTAAYIDAVQNGPSSCMQWAHLKSESELPYNVYAPELGWHMAVNIMGVKICGRCMCLEYNGEKTFVRSYHQSPDGTYSPSDTVLEAWLKDQGYTRKSVWPIGAKLA